MMTQTIRTVRPAAAGRPVRYGIPAAARAARSALQWRLLVLWAGALLLPTLVAALPVWQMLSANLDHAVHAAALASKLDLVALGDLAGAHTRYASAVSNGGVVALVATLLLSPLLTGMTISAARAPTQLGFGALVAGGLQEYPRLARMLLWAVVPLGIAGVAGAMAVAAAHKYGEAAVLPADADRAGMIAMVVAGLLLVTAHATLDAGRAVLALDRRRRSAVVAWWGGCKMVVRRPLMTLGVYLAVSAAGLALAALLGVARINVPPLGAGGFIVALALTQLAVVAVAWMRSARLFAMMELARDRRG